MATLPDNEAPSVVKPQPEQGSQEQAPQSKWSQIAKGAACGGKPVPKKKLETSPECCRVAYFYQEHTFNCDVWVWKIYMVTVDDLLDQKIDYVNNKMVVVEKGEGYQKGNHKKLECFYGIDNKFEREIRILVPKPILLKNGVVEWTALIPMDWNDLQKLRDIKKDKLKIFEIYYEAPNGLDDISSNHKIELNKLDQKEENIVKPLLTGKKRLKCIYVGIRNNYESYTIYFGDLDRFLEFAKHLKAPQGDLAKRGSDDVISFKLRIKNYNFKRLKEQNEFYSLGRRILVSYLPMIDEIDKLCVAEKCTPDKVSEIPVTMRPTGVLMSNNVNERQCKSVTVCKMTTSAERGYSVGASFGVKEFTENKSKDGFDARTIMNVQFEFGMHQIKYRYLAPVTSRNGVIREDKLAEYNKCYLLAKYNVNCLNFNLGEDISFLCEPDETMNAFERELDECMLEIEKACGLIKDEYELTQNSNGTETDTQIENVNVNANLNATQNDTNEPLHEPNANMIVNDNEIDRDAANNEASEANETNGSNGSCVSNEDAIFVDETDNVDDEDECKCNDEEFGSIDIVDPISEQREFLSDGTTDLSPKNTLPQVGEPDLPEKHEQPEQPQQPQRHDQDANSSRNQF